MAHIIIDKERCKGCELCVPECKWKLIAMSKEYNRTGYRYAEFSETNGKCTACKLCAIACPEIAIEVVK
ncbi:MAG: 4Fe-4S binding protein [Spirochaetes bacterium]|nr:4Fe-4S binding protein [Spirochaetota bacterium]